MSDREPVTGGREPLALAAWKRSPLALIGALPAGGGLLGILAAGGVDIGYLDVLAAVAVMLATAFPSLAALRGVVREVRPLVTPSAAPRNSAGERLVSVDTATMARALAQARVSRATPKRSPDDPVSFAPRAPQRQSDDWTGEAVARYDEGRAASVTGTRAMPSHREGEPRRDGRSVRGGRAPARRPTTSRVRGSYDGDDYGPIS